MAVDAGLIVEVRNGGSDTNGGGYVTGSSGTDWSQQTSLQYSVTDGVLNGTTTITSATAAFGTDVVGNLISISGGTGSAAQIWKQIKTRSSATTITVDSSAGLTAGTGVTLKIGGALASPGAAGPIANVQGNQVAVKYNASPYVASSASTNISGGCVAINAGVTFFSYDVTRSETNADANRATFQVGSTVASATLFGSGGAARNFILDGNSQTTSRGSSGVVVTNCHAINFTSAGFVNSTARNCSGTANTGPTFSSVACYDCETWANSSTSGFFTCTGARLLSYGHTGATGHGFANCSSIQDAVAYGCAGDAVNYAVSSGIAEYDNCIFEGNTGAGVRVTVGNGKVYLRNCADFNNTGGRSVASTIPIVDIGAINGSGSFFNNAASADFSLNNTAGAGALIRGTGFPQTFPRGLTASRPDVGASQHADSGSAGILCAISGFDRGIS